MEIKKISDAERLETGEGIMRPLIFGENLGLFHLEIPPHLDVPPHSHPGEGVLYCLEGTLAVISKGRKITIGNGTALLVGPSEEVGVKNLTDKPVKAILISSPPPVKSVEELKSLLKKS